MANAILADPAVQALPKTATGIRGLDEITGGGLPTGRPTLVCGTAGCGKTLLALEFLVRGAVEHGEPGVFIAFEERPAELVANVRSLGFDLDLLVADKKLVIDYVHVDPREIDETGEFDLEGLFVRLGHAIDTVGAKRVAIDTIESLFAGFTSHAILRSELRRLFRWLKDRGVTALITCERGEGTLTRHGLEEYVSDCVILLDHRVENQLSTRRLRIVKYRGSAHGADEYPFLIDQAGFSVLPITSLKLDHEASTERVSSGVAALDQMLDGKGYFRGSTILVSGTAGTGKTSLAAAFAQALCKSGKRCAYFAFEESASQLVRNMGSIGIDLEPHVRAGRLMIHASRPTLHGLEMHLATMHRVAEEFAPDGVVLDPVSNLVAGATSLAATSSMLIRLIDYLKSRTITAFFTSLTSGGSGALEQTEVGVSSLVDTWLMVRDVELGAVRIRGLYVLKSRGMPHSNEVRVFKLTDRGIALADAIAPARGNGGAKRPRKARA